MEGENPGTPNIDVIRKENMKKLMIIAMFMCGCGTADYQFEDFFLGVYESSDGNELVMDRDVARHNSSSFDAREFRDCEQADLANYVNPFADICKISDNLIVIEYLGPGQIGFRTYMRPRSVYNKQ